MFVCVEGECSELKVVDDDGVHATMFTVQRDTGAVVLDDQIHRRSTPFFLLDVAANCSTSSSTENWFTIIHTQVTYIFTYKPPLTSSSSSFYLFIKRFHKNITTDSTRTGPTRLA